MVEDNIVHYYGLADPTFPILVKSVQPKVCQIRLFVVDACVWSLLSSYTLFHSVSALKHAVLVDKRTSAHKHLPLTQIPLKSLFRICLVCPVTTTSTLHFDLFFSHS